MSSTEPDQGIGENTEAVEMLTQGQELAFQLRDLLLDDDKIPVSGERLILAEDLLHKIHGSFTNTISALDRRRHSDGSSDQMAESGETSRPRSAPASRRRRSREISESGESWTETSSTLVHDGHAWRKYGQKPILDAKHSRSYFKCTHKDQYKCPAKKHVQQIEDNPLTYRTVYTFKHTCTSASLVAPSALQMLDLGSTSVADHHPADMNQTYPSTMILNFQTNQNQSNYNNNNNNNELMKQEYISLNEQITTRQDQQMIYSNNNNNVGSLSDVGGGDDQDVPHDYMKDFVNNYSTDYIPYSSQPPDDTDERWFD